MAVSNCFGTLSAAAVNLPAILISVILAAAMFLSKRFAKKKLSPILLIVISAFAGILVYSIPF
jgi:chromate transporter